MGGKLDTESLNRREFLAVGAAACANLLLPGESFKTKPQDLDSDWVAPKRLSYLAYRGTDFEGAWYPSRIDGQIPKNLSGTLYRTGPGSKFTQGTRLSHFFDGDALVTAFRFDQGQVHMLSRFVQTKQRLHELQSEKMLYTEFGTRTPGFAKGYKYAPNVSVVPWGQELLALGESSHPIRLRPDDLSTLASTNFSGSWPEDTSFTAHPRLDPISGNLYCFGISRSLQPKLHCFRLDKSGRAHSLASVDLGGYRPVHDFMITQNYLVFLIPPLKVDLFGAVLQQTPIAELLRYDESESMKIAILRKDGRGKALVVPTESAGLAFHHLQAFECDDILHLDSFLNPDASPYEIFKTWSSPNMQASAGSSIVRFSVDLQNGRMLEQRQLTDQTPKDFPCIDNAILGQEQATAFFLEARGPGADSLAFNALVRRQLRTATEEVVLADKLQMFGEPVLVPGKKWILHLGYDSTKDESFLDIRHAESLAQETRIWLGRYLPLGFHGSFQSL